MENWRMKKSLLLVIVFILVLAGCSTVSQDTNLSDEAKTVVEQPTHSATIGNTEKVKQEDTLSDTDNNQSTDTTNEGKTSVREEVQSVGELSVHYIDVGQGASQLLIGPTGKTILIDAGKNNMEETVVGYLENLNITKIDILIGTHPDSDHTGGLDKVIDNFDIDKIYMPKVQSNTQTFESVLLSIQNKGLKVTTAKAGLTLAWEPGIDIEMIAPVSTYNDANEMSAVIHLTYGQTSFLFTGDAETNSESDMLSSEANLKADVLLVGHHGSNTSTGQVFLERVNPTYGVIQSGENSYGHPAQEVLQRLNDYGVSIYRNDEQGNIVFTSNGKDITVAQKPWEYTAVVNVENEDVVKTTPQPPKEAFGELVVKASIDNESPGQNANVTVTVKVIDGSGNPVSGADVSLNLHYKSKDTLYKGTTNANGVTNLTFKIGRAAKGFTVDGDITVSYGEKSSNATVSFTPK